MNAETLYDLFRKANDDEGIEVDEAFHELDGMIKAVWERFAHRVTEAT